MYLCPLNTDFSVVLDINMIYSPKFTQKLDWLRIWPYDKGITAMTYFKHFQQQNNELKWYWTTGTGKFFINNKFQWNHNETKAIYRKYTISYTSSQKHK